MPYEPLGADRPRMATALRANIMAKRLDGSEYVVRFAPGERFKVKLPSGEQLLAHATFDECGTSGGTILIRARVCIPCQPDEPYRDVVEFAFTPEEWDMPAPIDAPIGHHRYSREAVAPQAAQKRASPHGPIAKKKNNVRNSVVAILAIGTALTVGEVTSGIMSDAWKKAQSVMDSIEGVDEKTRRDPPSAPPIQLPEPWIRY